MWLVNKTNQLYSRGTKGIDLIFHCAVATVWVYKAKELPYKRFGIQVSTSKENSWNIGT